AKSVGRPLFFALLVITVSFIPVFSLEAQEGRLFKPLAFTKTFSMFFAALLGVTLVPVLMLMAVPGKITPEIKNPINRFLIWAYQPFVNFVLRFRWFTLVVGALLVVWVFFPWRLVVTERLQKCGASSLAESSAKYVDTLFPYQRLGNEFMQQLN